MISLRAVHPTLGMSSDEAAAYWLVRNDEGELTTEESCAFDAWLAGSAANADAYARARAAWHVFDEGPEDPHLQAIRQSALKAQPEPQRRWWSAAAAAVAGIVAVGLFVTIDPLSSPLPSDSQGASSAQVQAPAQFAANSHETRKGERRTVRLSDGSLITLNTDSAVTTDFAGDVRLVRLLRGQALFDVAKDASRRFVVEAAGRRVTALGTLFEVRLDPGRMKVLLVEGRVIVEKMDETGRSTAVEPASLRPGQVLVAELGAKQRVEATDVTTELLWKDGFVSFENEPLSSAVAEINRYSNRPIVIRDEAAGSMRLSGVFKTGNPERFAALVSELLPVTSRPRANGELEIVASQRRTST